VGTAILVDRKTAPLVKDNEILLEGRAQYIMLQFADNGSLTIVNVYVARSSNDKAPMWKKLSKAEFTSDHIIVGGDFNHLEETTQRGTLGERQMPKKEAASWHHMTLQYGMSDAWCLDSFRKMSKKAYTYDNGRSGASSAISRIDKFLVSQDIDSPRRRIESTTSVRKLSNHSPLIITIWGQPITPNNMVHYFDSSLLGEEESKTKMVQAWANDLPPPTRDQEWPAWLEVTINRVMRCNTRLARTKKCL
jgi:exonuclease III